MQAGTPNLVRTALWYGWYSIVVFVRLGAVFTHPCLLSLSQRRGFAAGAMHAGHKQRHPHTTNPLPPTAASPSPTNSSTHTASKSKLELIVSAVKVLPYVLGQRDPATFTGSNLPSVDVWQRITGMNSKRTKKLGWQNYFCVPRVSSPTYATLHSDSPTNQSTAKDLCDTATEAKKRRDINQHLGNADHDVNNLLGDNRGMPRVRISCDVGEDQQIQRKILHERVPVTTAHS